MTAQRTAERSVLITGAAGFVGQHVARALLAAGWHVIGLDRAPPADAGASPLPFTTFLTCDLLDEGMLERCTSEHAFDAIVHLAGLLPARANRMELFAVNAGGTSAVLDRVAAPGMHVVLFSSGLVYGAQPGPFREDMPCMTVDAYAQSKLAAETVATSWGRGARSPVAVLRPSVLYGPGAPPGMLLRSLLETLRKGEPFEMTAGEQLRDFLHVEDVAQAVLAVLNHRADGTWNLASSKSMSVREAAAIAARIAGRPELLQPGALPYREHEVFDYRLDASKLRAAVGWQPRIELANGLSQLWKALP